MDIQICALKTLCFKNMINANVYPQNETFITTLLPYWICP